MFDPPDPGRTAERLGRTPAPASTRGRRSLLGKKAPAGTDEAEPTLVPTAPPVAATQATAPPQPPPQAPPPIGLAPTARRSTWEPARVEPEEAETRRYRTGDRSAAKDAGPRLTGALGEETAAPAAPPIRGTPPVSSAPIAGSIPDPGPNKLPIAGSIASSAASSAASSTAPAAEPPPEPPAAEPAVAAPAAEEPRIDASVAPPAAGQPVGRVSTNSAWDPEPTDEVPYESNLGNAAIPREFVEEAPTLSKASAAPPLWVWAVTIVVLLVLGAIAVAIIGSGVLFGAVAPADPPPAPIVAPVAPAPPPPAAVAAPAPPVEAPAATPPPPAAPIVAPAARARAPAPPVAAPPPSPAPAPTEPSPWGALPDDPAPDPWKAK